MESDNIFGKHQFLPGDTKAISLNNSRLFVKREKEGWYFLTSEKLNEDVPDFSKGEYFHTGKSNSLVIAPTLPDKPLVFKGNMLKISASQKLTFFIKIPVSIQFYYSKHQPENLLKEIAAKRLSGTWFGEPDSGEPALAIGNEYFFEFDAVETSPLETICPVTVINNSAIPLELQRLIIRTENLAIYKNGDKKVTGLVHVEFSGQDVTNSAKYTYSKTYDGEKQEIFVKSRSANKDSLKTHFIRQRSVKN